LAQDREGLPGAFIPTEFLNSSEPVLAEPLSKLWVARDQPYIFRDVARVIGIAIERGIATDLAQRRKPAAEIERSIAAAAQSILDDQQTVISAAEEAGLDSSRIAPLLKSAVVWSARLRFEQDNALSSLIDRVDLDQDGMRLSIKLPLSNAESGAPDGSSHLSIKRHVPMQIRRRGVELRLVINGGARACCKTDQSLLRAVARAHCWFDDLVSGRCGSLVEIAKRNGVGKQYVSRLIRLAFLAPDMVERIAAGRQPPELTAQALRIGRFDIPVGWAAQKRALGFTQPA
jgi:site-specific DNA recombinase